MPHLMIKDLEQSKELDRSAMLSIRGGLDVFNAQMIAAEAKAGIAAVVTATNVLTSINNDFDITIAPETIINIGGIA